MWATIGLGLPDWVNVVWRCVNFVGSFYIATLIIGDIVLRVRGYRPRMRFNFWCQLAILLFLARLVVVQVERWNVTLTAEGTVVNSAILLCVILSIMLPRSKQS